MNTILYSFSFDQPSSGGGHNLNKNWCLLHNSHKKNIESTYDNCLSMIMQNQKRVMVTLAKTATLYMIDLGRPMYSCTEERTETHFQ